MSVDKSDEFFARLAVQLGHATGEQVQACLTEKARLGAEGRAIELGTLMVDRRVLTREQVAAIVERQNKRDLICPNCATPFTVLGLPHGKTLPCKHCKTPLVDQNAPAPLDFELPSFDLPHVPTEIAEMATQLPTGIGSSPQVTISESSVASSTPIPTIPGTGSSPTVSQSMSPPPPRPSGVDPLIGCTLGGKFQIQSKLGQGGMGAVYLAQQINLDRACAIKVLPQIMASDPVLVQRFQQEARACAALDAPNVVRVHDVDADSGYHYLAMEYVEGQGIDELIRSHGKIPWKKAVDIARQAALGLGAAHEKGIIHRDIKPANLMMTHTRVVKVMDFGLARLRSTDSHLTQSQQILGTPHYMSPEQASGETCDTRTDIYSLGASLYYMVTGQTPFDAPVPTMLLLKVLDEVPQPVHEVVPKLPGTLGNIVARMMAKAPEDRYADTAELIADFDRLLGGQRVEAGPAPPQQSGVRRQSAVVPAATAAPAVSHQQLMIGGAIAVGLLLLIVLAVAFSGGDDGSADALAQLQSTARDDKLSLEDRLLACTRFDSDFPGATSDQQIEVDQLRRQLKKQLEQRQSAERKLELLVDRIIRLLEQKQPARADGELAAFRTRYGRILPGLHERTSELRERINEMLAAAGSHTRTPGDGSGSGSGAGSPATPVGEGPIVREYRRLLARDLDAAASYWSKHYDEADFEVQARLDSMREEAIVGVEQRYRKALDARDWGGAERAISDARALAARRQRLLEWTDELAGLRGGPGSQAPPPPGGLDGVLRAIADDARRGEANAGLLKARGLLDQLRKDAPDDWNAIETTLVQLGIAVLRADERALATMRELYAQLHGVSGKRAPYLALLAGATTRYGGGEPGRSISADEIAATRLIAAALDGGVPIGQSLATQLDLHSVQSWMSPAGIATVIVDTEGRRHACLRTHRGRGEVHIICPVDPTPFGDRPPFTLETRTIARSHRGKRPRNAKEAERAFRDLERGSLLPVIQLTLVCKMKMIFAHAPGPPGRDGGDRGKAEDWRAAADKGDAIVRERLRNGPRLDAWRTLALLAIGARLIETEGDPELARLATVHDKLARRVQGRWADYLEESARDLRVDRISRTAKRFGPPGGGSGRRGDGSGRQRRGDGDGSGRRRR